MVSDQHDETALLRERLKAALATVEDQQRQIESLRQERDRWLTRVKILERRLAFAAEALDHRLDDRRGG